MIPLSTIFTATTLLTHLLAHDPRVLDRRAETPIHRRIDDVDLDLMESGFARRLPPVRVPHSRLSEENENGAAVAGPSFPLRTAMQQQQYLTPFAGAPPPQSQLHPLEQERQQYLSPFARPPPLQAMSSDIEMADLGPSPLLGPNHVGSSATNGTLPPPAMSTGSPSISQCMQCVQSCVGAAENAREAVEEYCSAIGQHPCVPNADEQVACAVFSMVCCSTLAVLVGMYERGS